MSSSTLTEETHDYRKSQGAQTPGEVKRMQNIPYASALGSIIDVMPPNKRPMEMLCDNAPAIAIANDPGIMRGARHYQRKYHYVREVIQAGEIVLKKVHTDDNLADPFTKPMSYNKRFEHAMGIGVCPASSLM
ncbi:hypothetical protein Tco_1412308 [Tanacetum coccineum]